MGEVVEKISAATYLVKVQNKIIYKHIINLRKIVSEHVPNVGHTEQGTRPMTSISQTVDEMVPSPVSATSSNTNCSSAASTASNRVEQYDLSPSENVEDIVTRPLSGPLDTTDVSV